jgi:molybdenum cofactor cytidylyltransferase
VTLAILPAAGSSRRMGRPKLLLPWGETTVVGAVVAALRGAGVETPLLVLGPADGGPDRPQPGRPDARAAGAPAAGDRAARHPAGSARLPAGSDRLRAWAAAAGIAVAENPRPERGMLSSIQAGVEALGGGAALARRGEVLLVCPADLPALRAETVRALLAAMQAAAAPLALPVHGGRRGHPLAIAAHLVPEIARLDPAIGLRELRDRHAGELLALEVEDPGCVADLDTPADYAGLAGFAPLAGRSRPEE